MRIRTLKPSFFQHEELSELSAEAHLMAAGLLDYADDEGYFNANPRLIQGMLFPLRTFELEVEEILQLLVEIGYLEFLPGTDGKRYARVVKFLKHQVVSHPKPSLIKELCDPPADSSKPPGRILEVSVNDPSRSGTEVEKEGKGSEKSKSTSLRTLSSFSQEVRSLVDDFEETLDRQLSAKDRISYADAFDKCLRIDKRDLGELRSVMLWARNDDFWSGNFLSALKLRRKSKEGVPFYDIFLAQMHRQNTKSSGRPDKYAPDQSYLASAGLEERL